MARKVIERVLDRISYNGAVTVAPQNKPMDTIDVMAMRRKNQAYEQMSLL